MCKVLYILAIKYAMHTKFKLGYEVCIIAYEAETNLNHV